MLEETEPSGEHNASLANKAELIASSDEKQANEIGCHLHASCWWHSQKKYYQL